MTNVEMEKPLEKMNRWLEIEKTLSPANPNRIVIATSSNNFPHSRIVAIREITTEGVIFFTQQGTKKVNHLTQNPYASATLWLAQQQRQVILDGTVKPLTAIENRTYWEKLPREQQLRFTAYAPTSSQPIESTSVLEMQLQDLEKKFANQPIPISPFYCGFHLIPGSLYFYTLGSNSFSQVFKYEQEHGKWHLQLLSP